MAIRMTLPARSVTLNGQAVQQETGRLPLPVSLVMAAAGLAVLASYGAICLAHLRDSYQLDHVSGVWIALAHHLNQGVLYPAIYDGQVFGGSRYMPGYFALHAGLAQLTGESVFSGKLLSFTTALVCLGLVLLVSRQIGCSWPISLCLTSLAAASTSVLYASTTIRGDLLPVVWQLAALALIHRGGRGAPVAAGLCCALAVLCKMSALWAPAAIVAWMLLRDRRNCGIFLLVWLGTLAASMGLLHVVSSGRMLESMEVFSEPAFLLLLLKSPLRLCVFAARTSPTLVLLVPLALVECWRTMRQRQLTVFHFGFMFGIGVVLVIFADRGTVFNHLVDLEMLAAIVTGLFWTAITTGGAVQLGMRNLVVVAILWGLVALGARNLGHPVRDIADAWLGQTTGDAPPALPLANIISSDGPLLCEDPRVAVERGQTPVVLDPYALPLIEKKHPAWVQDLVRRIRNKEFLYVVLQYRLDTDPEINEGWYRIIFGRQVAAAIRENYEFRVQSEGFCVFVPAKQTGQ